MSGQLLVGGAASLVNIGIHALWMALVSRTVRRHRARVASMGVIQDRVTLMIATVAVLMLAHLLEVFVWSLAYGIVGATPAGEDGMYFAFVNYTTLGYGDITPVKGWRLLGPMTAMNGILLFGWSTAIIIDVLEADVRSFQWRHEGTGGRDEPPPAARADR